MCGSDQETSRSKAQQSSVRSSLAKRLVHLAPVMGVTYTDASCRPWFILSQTCVYSVMVAGNVCAILAAHFPLAPASPDQEETDFRRHWLHLEPALSWVAFPRIYGLEKVTGEALSAW